MPDPSQVAIQTALSQDWEQAIIINEQIINENGSDIDALNRLAYAYTQVGKIESARKIYRKILSLDKYNYIARKNLDKIHSLPKTANHPKQGNKMQLSPSQFIEEPGKTKTIILTNVAPNNVLSQLSIGDTVVLSAKKHSIEVRDINKTYIGALPDDLAFRLLRFLKGGNSYHVCIKNTAKNNVTVFIRETKRGKRNGNRPSFLTLNHEGGNSVFGRIRKYTKNEVQEPSHSDSLEEEE